jgi:hypothetical protein
MRIKRGNGGGCVCEGVRGEVFMFILCMCLAPFA